MDAMAVVTGGFLTTSGGYNPAYIVTWGLVGTLPEKEFYSGNPLTFWWLLV